MCDLCSLTSSERQVGNWILTSCHIQRLLRDKSVTHMYIITHVNFFLDLLQDLAVSTNLLCSKSSDNDLGAQPKKPQIDTECMKLLSHLADTGSATRG